MMLKKPSLVPLLPVIPNEIILHHILPHLYESLPLSDSFIWFRNTLTLNRFWAHASIRFLWRDIRLKNTQALTLFHRTLSACSEHTYNDYARHILRLDYDFIPIMQDALPTTSTFRRESVLDEEDALFLDAGGFDSDSDGSSERDEDSETRLPTGRETLVNRRDAETQSERSLDLDQQPRRQRPRLFSPDRQQTVIAEDSSSSVTEEQEQQQLQTQTESSFAKHHTMLQLLAQKCPNLESFPDVLLEPLSDPLFDILFRQPSVAFESTLTRLHLPNMDTISSLKSMDLLLIARYKHLTHLLLGSVLLTDSVWTQLIPHLPLLQTVDIHMYHATEFTTQSMRCLAACHSNLRVLRLPMVPATWSGVNPMDDSAVELLSQGCPQMTKLSMSRSMVTDRMFEAARRWLFLNEMDVQATDISKPALSTWLQVMANPHLVVHVRGCMRIDDGKSGSYSWSKEKGVYVCVR